MNKLYCPRCGKRVIVSYLASNPGQYECYCACACGFSLRSWDRKDSCLEITQEELERENV